MVCIKVYRRLGSLLGKSWTKPAIFNWFERMISHMRT